MSAVLAAQPPRVSFTLPNVLLASRVCTHTYYRILPGFLTCRRSSGPGSWCYDNTLIVHRNSNCFEVRSLNAMPVTTPVFVHMIDVKALWYRNSLSQFPGNPMCEVGFVTDREMSVTCFLVHATRPQFASASARARFLTYHRLETFCQRSCTGWLSQAPRCLRQALVVLRTQTLGASMPDKFVAIVSQTDLPAFSSVPGSWRQSTLASSTRVTRSTQTVTPRHATTFRFRTNHCHTCSVTHSRSE